ncbi:NAP family protein [Cordyceps militaris CM01]|uniref:NAP family protein n=1 Tax=Cordyceps militaris (strain CM01) TaxID=983644 RepID=G3JTK6_CORMM|nr:NAP family protein [Cordyceps militaris CM01]EGX88010.1 NAP family protein [Cordyceps militaris CM01]
MADDKMEFSVSYSKLQELEDDFEDVEVELLRQQAKLSAKLYEKRAATIADIPNFWPLVLEQSPPDIDEYIQPTDSAVLLNHLVGLDVDRFELPSGGDPRSVRITMTFSENEYFSDKSLSKQFWWRYAKDGWTGLVSEPVRINWKSKDKDLTQGLLDLAVQLHAAEKAAGQKLADEAEPKASLLALIESTGLGGVSFFAWFGFAGRAVSAEESAEAFKVEQEKRQKRRAGEDVPEDDDDDEDDDLDEYDTEIFPTGDDLAVSLAEDVWPNAIKYFITAMEHDALSDIDFEDDDDDEDEEMEEADGEHTSKKRKA